MQKKIKENRSFSTGVVVGTSCDGCYANSNSASHGGLRKVVLFRYCSRSHFCTRHTKDSHQQKAYQWMCHICTY